VLTPAELEHAWLAEVSYSDNLDFDAEDIPKVRYEVEHATNVEQMETNEQDGSRWAVVRLDIELKWVADDDVEPLMPFVLRMAMRGGFTWTDGPIEEPLAQKWLEYNGTYLLWPYARSFIASLTAQGRLPALTLYTLDVPQPPELDDESLEDARSQATPS
jgi:preprotein translocase subunit SecB